VEISTTVSKITSNDIFCKVLIWKYYCVSVQVAAIAAMSPTQPKSDASSIFVSSSTDLTGLRSRQQSRLLASHASQPFVTDT
jgi:hypothetical protein